MLNKARIKESFSRAAKSYDSSALFQRTMGERMLEWVLKMAGNPEHVLDIGMGTGRLSLELGRIYPSSIIFGCDLAEGMVSCAQEKSRRARVSNVTFCQAEAEHLPFRDNYFDLVISNLTYQWVEELELAFSQVFRVLKEGGSFYFTTLGEGSLKELSNSFAEAHKRLGKAQVPHGQEFISQRELSQVLTETNFSAVETSSYRERSYYPDTLSFLRWLKRVGARNVSYDLPAGLGNRRLLFEMIKIYEENYRMNGSIFSSFEVIFARGRKE
ncbi:malonyl-ACP O-methyltransferase BioC [candidate division NPL-UPA2 bacterium]|nr:malonyl-ACP O-methyltransferase BioC [candidate division NPL-UPA2 bacterium]